MLHPLKHIFDRFASDKIKKEMTRYVAKIIAFRRETQLGVFSRVYKRKEKIEVIKFSEIVTEYKIDISITTLEKIGGLHSEVCQAHHSQDEKPSCFQAHQNHY